MSTESAAPAGSGTGRRRVRRGLLTGFLVGLTVAVTALAGLVTVRLYAPSPLDQTAAAVVGDAVPRLAFVRSALDDGAGERMQRLFPEGYYFSHVLYGLTWVDVGMRDAALRDRALGEARWALRRIDSDQGRAPFSAQLSPPYGVFYLGWTSWLRGGVVRLAGGQAPESAQFFADTDDVADAFAASLAESGSPFLSAYPGQAWPVDSAVGLAALALADQLRGDGAHRDLLDRWWQAADQRRDPDTGLLPHRVDPVTGHPLEGARATSQTVMLRFLREVDPDAAARDWWIFRDRFGSTVPAVPGLREHPRGVSAGGDVDSGPLILGLSASASVVGLGTAVLFGDRATARALSGLAEATGGAVEYGGQRRYLGGAMPVGDAFLAWSRAADGWVVPAAGVPEPSGGAAESWSPAWSGWWRLPWQMIIGWLLVPWWLLVAARLRS